VEHFLQVKNWGAYQAYRDRDPKWIKFHSSILDDYEFNQLTEITQLHLLKLWLMAAKTDNKIPNDHLWIKSKISANGFVDIKQLLESGFLVVYESVQNCTNLATQESRGEDINKRRTSKVSTPKRRISEEIEIEFNKHIWPAYPKRSGSANKAGAMEAYARTRKTHPMIILEAATKRYAAYCAATDKVGTETTMMAQTFFGPKQRWAEEYPLPVKRLELPADDNALEAFAVKHGLIRPNNSLHRTYQQYRAALQEQMREKGL
jgi:hypothetical protein